jgi:ADP-heptose:LPS heptosyltransferase
VTPASVLGEPGTAPVVLRFGALGDMILTTGLLRALAIRHRQPCLVACLGEWNRALFRHLPFVGELLPISSRGLPYALSFGQQLLVRALARRRGAAVYVLEGDDRSHGFARRAGLPVACSLRDLETHDNLHQTDVHARVCGFWQDGAFADGFDPVPELRVSAEERAGCMAWLHGRMPMQAPPVLVHPGNKKTMSWRRRSGNIKEWPAERWVAVIQGILRAEPERAVLITGTDHEAPMAQAIALAAGDPRVAAVAGETPLRRLLALLTLADSLVSVDTGPAHAAGALGCPVVALFGQTDPRANRPLSRRAVRVVTGPPDAPELAGEEGWRAHHHMLGIAPEAVLAAWQAMPRGPART